ncbi:MAG: hypothetical protein RLZZ28_40 [Bacteroidota bacterium]
MLISHKKRKSISQYELVRIFTTKLFVYIKFLFMPYKPSGIGTSLICLFSASCFLSFREDKSALPVKYAFHPIYQDTTPALKKESKKNLAPEDIDLAMKEINRAMSELQINLKQEQINIDREIKAALEEVKKIDYDKLKKEIAVSLSKVDWEKTRMEVDKAIRDARIEIKQVDMIEIKKEIAKAMEEVNAAKIMANIDMKKMKESINLGMEKAKIGLEKAKKELQQLKLFIDGLEKDGLIDKKKAYLIEIKKGELFINGQKQPAAVNEKYKSFIENKEGFSLKNDGDDMKHV